jgi:Tfp pilus assembly protein PilF
MRQPNFMVRTLLAASCVAALAAPALAQTGRVGGTVKDDTGQPIKGATVTAENPQASPSSFTATTDDKGRYSIIGMKSGRWTFKAEAPGFAPQQGVAQVATIGAPNPPVNFTLAKGAVPAPSGPLAGISPQQMKAIQGELASADAAMAAGNFDQAITEYQAIKAKVPTLTAINLAIGQAYRRKKDYDSAIKTYQEMLTAEPTNDKAQAELGMTYMEKGDFKAAETSLDAAAKGTGAGREIFYNLGEVKMAAGKTDDAAAAYKRATEIDPAWMKPVVKLGIVAISKGDTKGAIELFEKVVAADPSGPDGQQAAAFLKELKK